MNLTIFAQLFIKTTFFSKLSFKDKVYYSLGTFILGPRFVVFFLSFLTFFLQDFPSGSVSPVSLSA